ncbi:MAG TPA: arylesterase [Psychromonas hadalis]|nr:arylesterase [Psychromonas hadalis]
MKRIKIITTFLISLFFLAACSEPKDMLPTLNDTQPILAFGDSLTFGYGANPSQSYPAQLSQLIGKQIINKGINGELSEEGLKRLPSLIDKLQPQLLLLCHGANDMLQKKDLTIMQSNVRKMVEIAQSRGVQVVLISVPKVGLILSPPPQYSQIAAQLNIPLENDIISDVLQNPSLHSDMIHPKK